MTIQYKLNNKLKYLLGAFRLGGTHGPSKREICARNTNILRKAVRTSVLGQLKRYSQNLKTIN